jgi:hypothetical protein
VSSETTTIDGTLDWFGEGYEQPDQVLDVMRAKHSDGLEFARRICLAQIELAIRDYCGNAKRRLGYSASARAWILADYSSSKYPDIRTFDGCCMSLGLEPEVIRREILRLGHREGRARRMGHAAMVGRRRKAKIVKLDRAAAAA